MKKKIYLVLICNLFLLEIFAQNNPQNTFQHQIDFSTTNQNMWGEGDAFSLDMEYHLIGSPAGENGSPIDIHEDLGFDYIHETLVTGDYGIALNFGIGIYLSSVFSVQGFTGGSIDINYPATVTIDYPDHCSFFHGQTVPIQTSLAVRPSWELSSHFPSGGIVYLDFEYGFMFSFGIELCLGSCTGFNFDIGYPAYPGYDPNSVSISPAGVPYDSMALFYINTQIGDPNYGHVAYPCVNENGLPTICNDEILPITIPDILDIGLTGEINIPYVETTDQLQGTCLVAEGEDMWAWFNLDAIHFLLFWSQFIPPPAGEYLQTALSVINGEFDLLGLLGEYFPIDLSSMVEIDYYLLHINLYMQSYLHQKFEFCPTIEATFTFPTELEYTETNGNNIIAQGVSDVITIDVGNNLNITYPCYGWDSMQIANVHYHFVPTLKNRTWNEFKFQLLFDIIHFEININIDWDDIIGGILPSISLPETDEENNEIIASEINLNDYSITEQTNEINATKWSAHFCLPSNCGPLFSHTMELGSINLDLFNNTWLVGGWNITDVTVDGTWLYPKGVINIQDANHSDVICFGDTTGVLTTTVGYATCGHTNSICDPYNSLYAPNTAGPWTFNYSWQDIQQTSNTTTNSLFVPSGLHEVTVSDVFGCTTSVDYEVVDLYPEILLALAKDDALCFGTATGNLYSDVTGGNLPYSWHWTPSGSTLQNPTGIFAGMHTLNLTDNQGCLKTDSIFVGEPAEVVVEETITNISCFGFSDGAISIDVTGGILPYSYNWSNQAGNTNNISNIPAGIYSVDVTDANDCVSTHTYEVTEPDLLELTVEPVNILCHGESTGSINLTVTGGTPPYNYQWSNGAASEDLSNLTIGTYTVTVTDNNNCQEEISVTLTEPTEITSTILATHNICFGGNAGSADLNVEGGIPPYTYSWSNGETTEDIVDLFAGTYTVTITDNNNCSLTNEITITQPPQIIITPTVSHVSCFGLSNGSISVVVTDGVPPYTYSWSNGATGVSIGNLPAGNYSLIVTDANTCQQTLAFNITQPTAITATGTVANVACHGESTGAIDITTTGGTIPYTYIWSNTSATEDLVDVTANNYTVTIIDANGCSVTRNFNITQPSQALSYSVHSTNISCFGESNGAINLSLSGGTPPYNYEWSNAATTQNISNLGVGDYSFVASDANACIVEDIISITEPPLLEINSSLQHISCYGFTDGKIQIETIGGTPPYSYLWNDGSILATRSNLGAGSYSLTITDSHNCSAIGNFELQEPGLLLIQTNINDITCYNQATGIIDVAVTGGVAPYQYQWSTGETSEDLTNILPGTYYLTVVDANNCQSQIMATINQPPAPLQANIEATMIRCFGDANGIANLVVSGGTPPYSYLWNTGEIQEDLTNLTPGIYSVTVSDNNSCNITAMTQILQASTPLIGEISGIHEICNGDSVGAVFTAISGGVLPYHYDWSNGSWENHIENLPAGTYTVTVTDAHFCDIIMEFKVTEPDPFLITTYQPDLLCIGMTAEIGLSLIHGNNPPYTIEWSTGESGTSIETKPSDVESYTVTITDSKNCKTDRDITVHVIDSIFLDVTSLYDTVCPNTDVAFFVHVEGGGKNEEIVYINGQKYPITIPIYINVNNDTSFVFEVSDTCEYNKIRIEKNIVVRPNPPIAIESDKFEGCAPLTVQFYETSEDIGQSYLWNFDDGDIENLSIDKNTQHTFYSSKTFLVHLRVESEFGCISEADYPIQVFPEAEAAFDVNSTVVDMMNPNVEFYDFSNNGYYYYWTFGDGTTSTEKSPQHSYNEVGEFLTTLQITSMQGCVDTTTMKITVNYSSLFYAPTAFTPNDDGLNDKFVVFLSNYQEESFEMKIFDRNGEVIFKTNDLKEGWNGTSRKDKKMPVGSYPWMVKYKDIHGEEFTQKGTVTLLK